MLTNYVNKQYKSTELNTKHKTQLPISKKFMFHLHLSKKFEILHLLSSRVSQSYVYHKDKLIGQQERLCFPITIISSSDEQL